MITGCLKWLTIAALAASVAAGARAADREHGGDAAKEQVKDQVADQQARDLGKTEFQAACTSCHGLDGKGDGPVAGQLKVAPPDLTALAKKNGGVFPVSRVYDIIDGRQPVSAHGTRDMPVWGERFNPVMNIPHIVDPFYDALDPSRDLREVVVRTRILAVIDYLNRIQQK